MFGSIFAHTINIIAFAFVTILSPIISILGSPIFGISETAKSTLFQKEFTDKQRATMGSLNALAIPFKLNGTVLGLVSNEFSSQIVMYPNPVKNDLIIVNPISSSENFIEIFDMTGRLVHTSKPEYALNLSIDVADLKSGNYIVKLKTENGTAIKNFIKI